MTSASPTLAYLKTGLLALVALGVLSHASDAQAARCLFVSSYHQGYAWSDGVERGLRSVLEGQCEIKQFDMDTKRRKSEDEKQSMAMEAKALIESWQPDIVITADVPLAARCLEHRARVLGPTGRTFTEDSIGGQLATRDLKADLREMGVESRGPRPLSQKDRSRFLSRLDDLVQASLRDYGRA